MKVKVFEEFDICQLEIEVNKFLEQVKGVNIIDIKYSTLACNDDESYTAIIIYEEEK